MKSRYIIGFFVLFLTAGLLLTASYQYTYRRAVEKQMAQEDLTGEISGTESIAAEGEAVKETDSDKEGFYLCELQGFVVVYLNDKKTIYEFTEIPLTDLPQEVQQEVADGKYVHTAEELYAFLENYSS